MSTYAVLGDTKTAPIFEEYIRRGAFHDVSIYLSATDDERVRRIYENNPNDPDLKYPKKWRENDLELFADKMKLNYYQLDTNDKTSSEVFALACNIIDREFEVKKNYHLTIKNKKN